MLCHGLETKRPSAQNAVSMRKPEPTPGPGRYSPSNMSTIGVQRRVRRQASPSSIFWASRGSAPSIPVVDQAWGYEEGIDGSLKLQQPEQPSPTPPGPGYYSPASVAIKRASPMVGFSAGTGRQTVVPEACTRSAAWGIAPGDYEGEHANPKPYTPLPSSIHPPKLYSSIPPQVCHSLFMPIRGL